MSEQANRDFAPSASERFWSGLSRQAQEVLLRLWERRWLVLATALTIALLVVAGALSASFALAAILGFVICTVLVPRTASGEAFHAGLPLARDQARLDRELEAIIAALPDPAVLLNAGGQVLSFNARAGAVFPSLRSGAHISSLIRTPEFLDALAAAPKRAHPLTVAYSERVPIGRRMTVTVAPLVNGPSIGLDRPHLLVLLRDVTEGERINQMRADFIAHASHELRTPLASLRGFIETLQGKAKDDEVARARFLAIMAQQAERMTRLIDDLLSLSRVEMNVHVPPSDLVDLNEVLNQVRDMFEPLARESGVTLELKDFGRRALVLGDRDELIQVFQNLIQNAFKYASSGKCVRVETAREPASSNLPAKWRIAVIDEGPGIAPEHLPRLTERFYRTDVASSREKGGTGLGLAIVKHILLRHRGELAIASTLGQGSTFTVVLPEARH